MNKKPESSKLGYMEKRELAALPQEIDAMEKEQTGIFEKMASPDFYKTDGAEIARLKARHDTLEHLLETAYARWEALEDKKF